ncbi:hypothetical protein HYU95_01205 [Candidatus Daviesbacteria bacterium]|nr:hypothetical protein [Candidatus Daviesbacteria bacterium]
MGKIIPEARETDTRCIPGLILKRALKEERDFYALKGLFARVTPRFYYNNSRGSDSLLLPFNELLKLADIHFARSLTRISLFIDALEYAKEPVPVGWWVKDVKNGPQKGEHPYHFILRDDEQPAISILQLHPQLQEFRINPVKQISGELLADTPVTTEFLPRIGSGRYVTVRSILEKMGLDCLISQRNRGGERWGDIVVKSDVPVFLYRNKYLLPKAQTENMVRFLRKHYLTKT